MRSSRLSAILLALPALAVASPGGDHHGGDKGPGHHDGGHHGGGHHGGGKPPKPCKGKHCKPPLVDSESLQDLINIEDLLEGAQALQDIADANGGTRAFGSSGHNATVEYLVKTLEATKYYDVTTQPFTELYAEAEGSIAVNGEEVASQPLTYTPSGSATGAPLIQVANLGCEAGDFPAEVKGAIAFVKRGECTFGSKSQNALQAGAAGVIIYNNEEGELNGTLGEPHLEYAPSMGISQEDSVPILAALEAGEVTVDLNIEATLEDRVTFNVLAETKGGDHDNVLVLGGHSDSVPAGPGIK